MNKKLPKNWHPDDHCFELMDAKGLPHEWILHQLSEFKAYWWETGEMKKAWGQTFRNWAYKNWEQVDKSRWYRRDTTEPQQDLRQPDPRRIVELTTDDRTITGKSEALEFLKQARSNLH